MNFVAQAAKNVSMKQKGVIIGTIVAIKIYPMKRIVIFHHVARISSAVRMPFVFQLNGDVMDIPIVPMQLMKPIAVSSTGFNSENYENYNNSFITH